MKKVLAFLIVTLILCSTFLIFIPQVKALDQFYDNFDTTNNWSNLPIEGWNPAIFYASYEISPAGIIRVYHPYVGEGRFIHSITDTLLMSKPYTFFIDVKYDTSSQSVIMLGRTGFDVIQILLSFYSDQAGIHGSCGISSLETYDFVSGNWYRVTFTLSQNNMGSLYINGTFVASASISEACLPHTYVLLGGGYNDNRFDNLMWSEDFVDWGFNKGFEDMDVTVEDRAAADSLSNWCTLTGYGGRTTTEKYIGSYAGYITPTADEHRYLVKKMDLPAGDYVLKFMAKRTGTGGTLIIGGGSIPYDNGQVIVNHYSVAFWSKPLDELPADTWVLIEAPISITNIASWSDPRSSGTESAGKWMWIDVIGITETGTFYLDEVAPPVAPDFEISVSPSPIITIHVGGWNVSTSLVITSLGGFSGSIQLTYVGSPVADIKFDQNPVYLPADSQVTVKMNVTSVHDAPLSTYTFVITATGSSITRELTLVINIVGNSIAVNNLVYLQQIARNDPAFSVQQNFFIAAPNGTIIYWGQNIVQVGRRIPPTNSRLVFSIFQIFSTSDFRDPVVNEKRGISSPKLVSFPVILNLTSYIDGHTLTLENNASSYFNSASLSLPEGSYVVGYPGSDLGFTHVSPENVVVGLPYQPYQRIAVFHHPTSGFVESYMKLVGELTWRSTQNVVLNILNNPPQTAEESRNLRWSSDGTFEYSLRNVDQGISFSPSYD